LQEIKELVLPPTVRMIVENAMPVMLAEKLHLQQVFSNLLSNAFKHNTVSSPEIRVRSKETEKYYEFSISDNGPGIEKECFEKIFVIFQTLKERDAFESTGVGLAIAKKVIDDIKGTINVKSELGKGATFTFTWPKSEAK